MTQNNASVQNGVQNNVNVVVDPNGLYPDAKAVRDKNIIMESQKEGAKYRSISASLQFLGGLLLTVGMAVVVPALKPVIEGSSGLGASLLAGSGAIGVAFIAVAAVATGISIVTDYIASRKMSSFDADKYELGAQHTARYIRKEIVEGEKIRPVNPQAKSAPVYEQNLPPASGKSWVQVSGRDPEQLALAAQANVNAQNARGV